MTRPKILLYLHHVELGQRYPVSEEVIIGRMTGHILFPKDERLSDKHCRIFLGPNEQLLIQDLHSDHGTVVDGRLLAPEKSYPIKEGTTIAVGAQVFKCIEPKKRPKPARKQPKKVTRETGYGFLLGAFFFVAAFFLGLGFYLNPQMTPRLGWMITQYRNATKREPPPPLSSPFDLVYLEIQSAYDQYRSVGREVQSGRMDNKSMAIEFRNSLIPKFQAAKAKLAVLKASNEFERRRIDVNVRLVNSILRQIVAMANFAETKSPQFAAQIEKLTPEVEAASEEARKVNGLRVPATKD